MGDTIMKDKDKLLTACGISTALFVSPWALICAGLAYAVIKYLNYCDKLSKGQEANSQPAEKSAPKETSNTGPDTTKETPEKEEFISQSDIDSLLNEGEEDPFIVKDPL